MLRITAEFERSNRFPKDIDVFAHVIMSWNASRRRGLIASDSKQGGVSEVTMKNSNTSSTQKRRATFLT